MKNHPNTFINSSGIILPIVSVGINFVSICCNSSSLIKAWPAGAGSSTVFETSKIEVTKKDD